MKEDIIVFLILMLSWSSWFRWWTFSCLHVAALRPISSFLYLFGLINPCSAHFFCFLILTSQETRSMQRRKSALTPWTESGFPLLIHCYFLLLHCYSLGPVTCYSFLTVVSCVYFLTLVNFPDPPQLVNLAMAFSVVSFVCLLTRNFLLSPGVGNHSPSGTH